MRSSIARVLSKQTLYLAYKYQHIPHMQLELSTELAGLGMTKELEGIDADEIERDIMDLGLGGSDSVSGCE